MQALPAAFLDLLDHHHAHAGVEGVLPHLAHVERAADADLYDALGVQQAFVHCDLERRAVVEAGTAIVIAGVAMGVDVDHAERAVLGDRAQDG